MNITMTNLKSKLREIFESVLKYLKKKKKAIYGLTLLIDASLDSFNVVLF